MFKPTSSSALWGRLVGGSDRWMIGASHLASYLLWFCILSLPACLHAHTLPWLQAPFILLMHHWKNMWWLRAVVLMPLETRGYIFYWHCCKNENEDRSMKTHRFLQGPWSTSSLITLFQLSGQIGFTLSVIAHSSRWVYSNKGGTFELWLIN